MFSFNFNSLPVSGSGRGQVFSYFPSTSALSQFQVRGEARFFSLFSFKQQRPTGGRCSPIFRASVPYDKNFTVRSVTRFRWDCEITRSVHVPYRNRDRSSLTQSDNHSSLYRDSIPDSCCGIIRIIASVRILFHLTTLLNYTFINSQHWRSGSVYVMHVTY